MKKKKHQKDMVFLNLRLNVYFGPPIFRIINFQSLTIYEIQFDSKYHFSYFLVSYLREERESLS